MALHCRKCVRLTRIPVLPALSYLNCSKCTELENISELSNLTYMNCDWCVNLTHLPLLFNLRFLKWHMCIKLKLYTIPLKFYKHSGIYLTVETIEKAFEYNDKNLEYMNAYLNKNPMCDRLDDSLMSLLGSSILVKSARLS